MGISNLTAMIIASRDDIICTSAGPAENGKYLGWITLGVEDRCRPLLNSEPIYNSHDEAKAAMEAVVTEVRQKTGEEHGKHKETSPADNEPGSH